VRSGDHRDPRPLSAHAEVVKMQGKSYRLHARARQKADGRISDTTFTRVAGFQPASSGRFSLFGDKGGG
jgi:hypothetical protein